MENKKVKRYLCSGYDSSMREFAVGGWVSWEDYSEFKDKLEKFINAGDAMHDAISTIDPQRFEKNRNMIMTDAEYLAVSKWRIAKNPDYNKA